ncbi:flagellar filament capping protein FliD [Salinibius halmophilus]|uniref:flagellar filament capping protein FliD n=1 Tax=Salinibius halmophilus TaxID=1853216 RepID=UPI000E66252A|nr:flagellar filament capping protein FliD [Salinibius halmophilus]
MASIESLGIGSGLLTNELVDQLVNAERKPAELRLDTKTAKVEAQISAYGTYTTTLSKLQQKAEALADSKSILKVNANISNDDALSVTTSSLAEEGNYRIAIDQLAQAHSLASTRFEGLDDAVGTGTLSIQLGEYTYNPDGTIDTFSQNEEVAGFDIEIDSSNNTLQGIRDAINNADGGVQASLVNDGQGFRLLLSSKQTGKEYAMRIEATGDAGLRQLAYNETQQDPTANMDETQQGTNANISVNGLAITSKNNLVADVIKGVTLNLKETTGSSISLDLSRDTQGMATKVEEFVEAYNEYRTVYSEVTKYDQNENVGGLLNGDSTIRRVNNQVRSLMTGIVDGLGDASVRSLADIGVFTDSTDGYKLAFDSAKFTAALSNNAKDVAGLLATDVQTTDSSIRYITRSADTVPGEYDITVSKLATQATLVGQTTAALAFTSPVVVDGSNDSFRMSVDNSEFTVNLEQGSYATGEDLALALQNAINQSAPAGKGVTVNFDDAQDRFSVTSNKFGSKSEIEFVSADPSVANTFGLSPSGQGEIAGAQYATLNEAAFAATTTGGIKEVQPENGIDFANNTVSFDISVDDNGVVNSASIVLDEDWSDIVDLNGNVTTDRNRDDALLYIQSELNSQGMTNVTAEFDKFNRLTFRTDAAANSQTITLSNVATTGADVLGLQNQTATSGKVVDPGTEFEIAISNRLGDTSSGTITIPDGTYQTGDELAAAIQAAINADPAIAGSAAGATTEAGSRDLSAVNFTDDPAEIVLNINGSEQTFSFTTGDGSDPLADLNAQLNAQGVEATLEANGALVLNTIATGATESLAVVSDGRGARTAAGSLDLSTDIDFSTNNAVFTLGMAGQEFEVTVDGATAGTDAQTRLAAIQSAIDEALLAETGDTFAAGDIVAKLDASNQVYFESVAKNGEQTLDTFGADAAIEIVSADTSGSNTDLGLVAANYADGKDALGLSSGSYQGFDGAATVSYVQDGSATGGFNILFDNQTTVSISNPTLTAISQLGLSAEAVSTSAQATGEDVEGTIGGVEAIGDGQVLTGAAGNEAATNGYLLGGAGWDFDSGSALVTSSNNTLKLTIDGTQSGEITVPEGAYASGNSLADALKTAINGDSALSAANKSVDVQFDENTGIFGIFSVSKGEQSTVKVDEITSGGTALFGFTTTTAGVNGKDAVGEESPAKDIKVRVTGGSLGERGSVNFVQGIAEDLETLLQDMLSRTGFITKRTEALENEKADIEQERADLDARMLQVEERYKSQFLFNDKIISRLKTTEDFLKQQFEAMAAAASAK